jgi:serine/threonine protein kinase
MHDFQVITVTKSPDHKIVINNPTNYALIGQGAQGAVFKISGNQCVKIYASNEFTEREYSSYQAAKHSQLTPKIYEKGPNYIIMEYLSGHSLDNYLRGMGMLPKNVTKLILNVLREMKRLHFTRIDFFLRHIFIDGNYQVKIIDLVNSYTIRDSFPTLLFGNLKELGLLKAFLQQVKELDPKIYLKWKQSPSFQTLKRN